MMFGLFGKKKDRKPTGKVVDRRTTFGSGGFQTYEELDEHHLCPIRSENADGTPTWLVAKPYLGGYAIEGRQPLAIGYLGDGHLMTIAPTRSGKGTCHVIPNLLGWCGSAIVIDIKGENHAITSRYRETFGRVYKFAPFDDDSHSFNPLFLMSRDEEGAWEDARLIADMLVVPDSGPTDGHWDREAKTLLTGLILHVATTNESSQKNLCAVRRLLMQSAEDVEITLLEMQGSANDQVKRTANAFLQKAEKERSAILSTAQGHTDIWDSPRLEKVTGTADFVFSEFKDEPATLYISIPPTRLSAYRPVLRLLIGMAIKELTETQKQPQWLGGEKAAPVMFFLDEFPSLGYMQPIEDGIAYLAGYGVKLWFFIQDLPQLEHVYKEKSQSILANCGCTSVFGITDLQTAKRISETIGKTTVVTGTAGRNKNDPMARLLTDPDIGKSEVGRPVLTAEEVMQIPDWQQVIFVTGRAPILCAKSPYYEQKVLAPFVDSWDQG